MEGVDAHVQQLIVSCEAKLDEILNPRSKVTLAEIAELRASGVSERRIANLYPWAISDYDRGYELLREGLGDFLSAQPALTAFFDLLAYVEQHKAEWYYATHGNHGNRAYLLDAVAIVHLLKTTPLKDLIGDRLYVAEVLVRLTDLESFLKELRYRQLLVAQGDPLRRLIMRVRHLPALLGLDGTPKVQAS